MDSEGSLRKKLEGKQSGSFRNYLGEENGKEKALPFE